MIGEIEETINRKVRESIDENQREYYLREKLRAIKEELGDSVPKEDDAEMIHEELEKILIHSMLRIKLKKNYAVLKQCQQLLQKLM